MDYKLYHIAIILSIASGLALPSFSLGQEPLGTAAPQTVEEVGNLGMKIIGMMPDAVKKVWREEALPFWQKMWEWAKPVIDPWLQKFLGLLSKEVEKRRPGLEQEFQKEKTEMQNDIWQRFKDLWRDN